MRLDFLSALQQQESSLGELEERCGTPCSPGGFADLDADLDASTEV